MAYRWPVVHAGNMKPVKKAGRLACNHFSTVHYNRDMGLPAIEKKEDLKTSWNKAFEASSRKLTRGINMGFCTD